MRVLFLTPWYPSDKDAMLGLFVQKHVEAVRAQGCDVRVLVAQTIRELKANTQIVTQWTREGWIPDVVQVNVMHKQVAIGLWYKQHLNVPYIIVEHWSGYLPENGQFKKLSRTKKFLYRLYAGQAEGIWTVSQRLQEAMQACCIPAKQWGTIDNVVDEVFFENPNIPNNLNNPNNQKTLLHVSCFDEKAKNVKGLLRAAKMLNEKRQDWKLVLVGTGVDYEEVRAYAAQIEIPSERLVWKGELTPEQVADEMHRADALVLSSRYETYGVVLAEASAAGLPILSTPVGIAEEVGALIVPQEIAQHKPGTFAQFMETVLWNKQIINHKSEIINQFTADTIGRKLLSIYDSCLSGNI